MKKIDYILLTIILLIGLYFRVGFVKIDTPLADVHSWRQADTAAVARNFARNGIDMMRPTYDDISPLQTGHDNPQGLRFVEFPIYNAIVAISFNIIKTGYPIEVYGRIVTAIFSLFTTAVIYYLALKENSRTAAVFSSGIFAIFPFFVLFSRLVLPETTATSFAFISIFFLHLYTAKDHGKKGFIYFVLSIISFACAVLVKPTAVFYAFALAYLFIRKFEIDVFKKISPYIFFILSMVPFGLWRLYISDYPEGIPASDWLFMYVNTFEGPKNIFMKPAFFRWIFFERIGIMMCGAFMTFFLVLGVIGKQKKYFIHSILFSALVYLFTFQGGNVQHNYYQTIILPAFALIMGIGAAYIIEHRQSFVHPIITYPAVLVVMALAFFYSYYTVHEKEAFYNYPNDLVSVAHLIKTFTKPEDKIVTDRTGDTTLLYLADRKGSPAMYKSAEEFKNDGYKYIVTANKDLQAELKAKGYYFLSENDQFAIIRL